MPGNEALGVNNAVGQQADLAITTHGSDWYFTVCAVMGVTTLAIMGAALRKPQSHRTFHYITASITAVACISYFSMGANLGQVPIQAEFLRTRKVGAAGTREIFYARYIDWAITTPLLLLDLLLTAGVPTHTILVTLLADEIMVVTGLVGALTRTSYKWGYWTFGMVALFFIAYELLWDARRHAARLGGAARTSFNTCGIYLVFIWFLYPIAWGLSEGGNVIHPDAEAAFYGVLDVFAKPIFGAILLWQHRNIAPANLGLHLRTRSELGATGNTAGTGLHEKHPHDRHGVASDVPGGGVGGTGGALSGTPAPAGGGVHHDGVHPEGPGPNVASNPAATERNLFDQGSLCRNK
ncbi:hypothetical protein SLS62_005014 [Diatrype stigma]|uniref:Bacteriorhodopsin n=1 Tax=Diatrype stigma TaxID=117547 RepID=A0AAN9YSW2_9PEZI